MQLLLLLLLALPATPEDSVSPPASSFKVMSFNIRYGTANDRPNHWDQRRDRVLKLLQEQQADIIGLQEALSFQIAFLKKALPQYQVIGVGRDDGKTQGEYSAILYRAQRFREQHSGTFWLSDTPEIPGSITWGNACTRVCTWAVFQDKHNERSFAVYNTHWDHKSQPSRVRSAALILERLQQAPPVHGIVLTGDLNADERNEATRLLLEKPVPLLGTATGRTESSKLSDTFRVLHPQAKNTGTYHGFKGDRSGGKIDVVLASGNFTVKAAAILFGQPEGRYPSDHFPVMAVLAP